jgi:hypothetical protein
VIDHHARVGIARGSETDFDSRPSAFTRKGLSSCRCQYRDPAGTRGPRATFACHFPLPLGGSSLARSRLRTRMPVRATGFH